MGRGAERVDGGVGVGLGLGLGYTQNWILIASLEYARLRLRPPSFRN